MPTEVSTVDTPPASIPDNQALRRCWHPVAYADALVGEPLRVTLLGEPLVLVRPEAPNSDEFPIFANEQASAPERRSRYQLHLPYTIVLRLGWGGKRGMVYFFASQPVRDEACTGYLLIGRNYDRDKPVELLQDFEDTIFEQDRRMVESQRPEKVPFDLAAEMHLKFDAVAVSYRRAMRKQGLAATRPR